MTSPQEELLLACPFCGNPPSCGEHRSSDESGETYGYSFIQCNHSSNQFCGVHGDSHEECLVKWNQRVESPQSIANRYFLLGLHHTGPKVPEPCAPPYKPLQDGDSK